MPQFNNIREHWDAVKQSREELKAIAGKDDEIYLVARRKKRIGQPNSTDDTPRISVSKYWNAALLLVQETHELASKDQVDAWIVYQAAEKKRIEEAAAKKDSKVNLDISSAIQAIASVVANAQNQQQIDNPPPSSGRNSKS